MSSDGCKEVAWKGNPFPYLLHPPGPGDSYKAARLRAEGHHRLSEDASTVNGSCRAATGTWDGPAPRGNLPATQMPIQQTAPLLQPDSVFLSSGYRMPLVGMETFKVSSPETIRIALDVGYRHFDCALANGNEAAVGQGLKEFIAQGGRSQLFITSKLWNDSHRPDDVKPACKKSIADLGCRYLDLYLLHWPEAWLPGSNILTGSIKEDKDVTLAQTWEAMQQLVDEGLVRSIGLSNCSLKQVEEVLAGARIKPCVNQVELHPMLAQRKLTGVCFRKGVQCVAYFFLGHYASDAHPLCTHKVVGQIAAEIGKNPTQVLLKWNVQRGVPVVLQSSSREQLQENLQLFGWVLSNEHKAALDQLDCGKRFLDFPWKNWGNPEEGGAAKPSQLL